MADVFVSYSHRDRAQAEAVAERLCGAGWSVWIDPRLQSGEEYRPEIEAAIKAARVVLVLWSATSIESRWVKEEANAGDRARKLMAVSLDGVDPPFGFGELSAINLSGLQPIGDHKGFDVLLQQLAVRLGRTGPELEDDDARAMRRLRRRAREAGVSGLLAVVLGFVAVVCLAAGIPGWVPRLRLLSLQARHGVAALPPSDALRVVLIDRDTVTALSPRWIDLPVTARVQRVQAGGFGGAWRHYHAQAVTRLAKAGARVIAMDIGFANPAETELEQAGTAELAAAIGAARAAGTAVVLMAAHRDETGALALQADLRAALLAHEPTGAGLLTHACVGIQQGWANLAVLLLSRDADDTPVFSLALASVASFKRALPTWERSARRLLLADGLATPVPYTGLGAALVQGEPGCAVALHGQRPVLRVIDPFPRELERGDPRVIPYEQVVSAESAGALRSQVAGRIALIGQHVDAKDRHPSCGPDGCSELFGLSLHVASMDMLLSGNPVIGVISPLAQLGWIAFFCAAVGWLRFANARRSAPWRFGPLIGMLALDFAISVYAAMQLALLVDTLHHACALLISYATAARVEPAARSARRANRNPIAPEECSHDPAR